MAELLLTEAKQGVLTITLNNPKTMNALNKQMLLELDTAVDAALTEDSVRVIVLTGAGKAFVAGADIGEMSNMDPMEAKEFSKLGASVFSKIENAPKPIIAAVNGFALGGGCELAMACDFRIASQKAKFGQPEVGLGITPGFTGTQRLPRLVGLGKAKELIFTGQIIPAEEAYRIGLADQIVEPDELMNTALQIADKIAANSASAVALSKESINNGVQTDMNTAIDLEVSLFALCFSTKDQKEGMKAFLEKRKPDFV